MSNGPSSPDIAVGINSPEVKAQTKNFSPLGPEFTMAKPPEYVSNKTEPPKYEEPDSTGPEMEKLMAMLSQEKPKNPQEALQQVAKNIPVEAKKSRGFVAQIIEWIKNLFRNLFK